MGAPLTIPTARTYRIEGAQVPSAFLDARISVAPDQDGLVRLNIDVADGRIATIAASTTPTPAEHPGVCAEDRMLWPTLIDMHAHLDKGQSIPRTAPDGTIAGGANGTARDRDHWSEADIRRRMEFGLRCAYAHGVCAIRTHLDSNHELTGRVWSVFRRLRDEWAGRVALQGVGLAPLDMFLSDAGVDLADLVAQSDGVLGGVTDGIGDDWSDTSRLDAALEAFLALASDRGLDVDLHVDQTDDIAAFALPRIAEVAIRVGFGGAIVCGHCVNLSLQTPDVVAKTLALCREANLAFVAMPTPMMYLMDRKPRRTPRWRGVTAAHEIRDAGLPIAIGGDNCRDAWFPYGDHDMVDTFQQALRVFQLDHPVGSSVAMIGPAPADICRFRDAGRLTLGGPANFIVFEARNFSELMSRPQSDRVVIRNGVPIDHKPPSYRDLD